MIQLVDRKTWKLNPKGEVDVETGQALHLARRSGKSYHGDEG